MELDKRSAETQRIIDHLLMPRVVSPTVDEDVEHQPLNNSKFTSWASKRQQLERASYLKAKALTEEAKQSIERNKTTAELEAELLDGTD